MKKITALDAYKAMYEFLDAHYHRTSQNDEIGSLLGSMRILSEKPIDTLDSAMWEDWTKAVDKIQKETKKQKGQN